MRLLQALIILIGSWSFMSIFIRCFELNVVNSYLITAILISEPYSIFLCYLHHMTF